MIIVHSVWHADSDSTALLSCNAHRTITVLQKQIKEPYNEQLINPKCSVFAGKS